jgi:outer membrane protein assembly factor BamB
VWGPVQLSSQPSLAYEAGKLFAFSGNNMGSGTLQAFNATSGTVLWTQSFTGAVFGNPGVIAANGLTYIASEGTLFAVTESSGSVAWSAPIIGGDSGTPAVTADGVYLIYPCQSYDFDPPSGTLVWQDSIANCGGAGGYTAQVANGQMYLPYPASGNGNGQLFNAETGVADGSFASGSGAFPVVSSTSSYYLSSSQALTDVQLSNGATLWTFSGDGMLNTSPLLVNNYVLIGSYQGNVYALDAATGAQVWQTNVGSTITGGPSPAALNLPFWGMGAGDGLLVVPSGTSVTAYLLSSNP